MSKSIETSVLFIGDPHIQIDNIPEVELCIEKLILLAKEKIPTFIVIAGDLLHTHERLHTTPLNKCYEFINEMRNISKTYVLVGNHDYENNSQFLTTNHWMNGLKEWNNVIIVDKVILEIINGRQFVFVPYVSPGRFKEALDKTFSDEIELLKSDCIFAHQEFFGCKMGAIISVEGDKWPLHYPNVISGHIHSRQTPQKNIYYPGSMLQHAFGESTKNIIACLIFKNSIGYDLEEINLELPRKKIIYMDVESVDDYKLVDTKDKIKITVSGSYEQFKALKKTKKYKKIIEDGIKVVFKAKKIEHKEDVPEKIVNETVFSTILSEIINNQKDSYLFQTYELVVNNKQIKSDDIFYIN
jgi:DNA repair exonuclease SbcCD nuclease subunit